MSLPQLRVRTEYSFKRAFGSCARVAERLHSIGCPAAGIVDTEGTWGHVDWEKALLARGIEPMFGREFAILMGNERKPRCWALGADLAAFYRFSSANPATPEAFAAAKGLVRFAGAALTDPETFDYVDINPRSRRRTIAALQLAEKTGKPLVVTSDNDQPCEDDLAYQLAWSDTKRMTPQHIMTELELRQHFSWIPEDKLEAAFKGCHEVAERLKGMRLRKAPIISVPGDLAAMVEEGKRYRLSRGHIKEWDQTYEDRVNRELAVIAEKQFDSYFIVVAELVQWAKTQMLVGPARGSSAGSLVCYLLRITEVDPLVHGLIFERFIDVNRSDLPDIDIDFNDQKRHLVFQHLAQKYGAEKVARIGSINRLQPRSVLNHVGRKLGIPHGVTFPVVNVLIEYSSGDSRYGKGLEDTLENTAPGRKFMRDYPEAHVMSEIENHASHTGVHAAGVIVSNECVNEYCTVQAGVAQVDKVAAEYINLLKIDALGLRTLGILEETGCLSTQDLYDLPLNDQRAFAVFNDRKYCGLFQFEGAAQRRVAAQVPVVSFEQIDHVTALARPGPLGGGASNHYINRNAGREEVTYHHPAMREYLAETYGVVLYQEQVMKIVRELGGFSWAETSVIRKAMSGRKGTEFFDRYGEQFVAGAAKLGIDEVTARAIWSEICTFGAWGMNKSHTVSYAIISYWCAYMKAHHPLEYAAACLRNAKDDEQTIEMLRELRDEEVGYVPFDLELSQEDWSVQNGRLIGGFKNLVGIGPAKAAQLRKSRDAGSLSKAQVDKILATPVKYGELSPITSMFGHIYDDPDAYNVHGPVKRIGDLRDEENAVIICKLVRLERRDENEAVRANRRGYRKTGQTLFVDAFVVDDSVSKPVVLRLRPEMWVRYGEKLADRAVGGRDCFLVRGRWLEQFSMLICKKIRCLTNPDMFE